MNPAGLPLQGSGRIFKEIKMNEKYYVPDIDKKLYSSNRTLRTYQGKLLFGPVGDRLYVDYLDKRPGFVGRIDFIHKCNITALFEVRCNSKPDFDTARCMWYPSKLTMEYEDVTISFSEIKTITEDDVAYSVQTWKNKSERAITLELAVRPEQCAVTQAADNIRFIRTPRTGHGYAVGAAVSWSASGSMRRELMPGESVTLLAAAACGNLETEKEEDLVGKVSKFVRKHQDFSALIETSARQYQAFFDAAPSFVSSDPLLNQTWNYRWYILRNCISKPNFGYLKHAAMYEGRGHKMGKTPMKPSRWEFSRLICLSSPLQLTDLKWHQNRDVIHDMIRSFFDGQGENGIVDSAFVDHYGSPFCNFMVWAVYGLYLLEHDKAFIEELEPKIRKFVDGNRKLYKSEVDELQVEVRHQRTGKEYQPSYWYFSDYPSNPKAEGAFTPLKRVDRTIYHYLNVCGCARLLEALGRKDYGTYEELAKQIAAQVNEKMWDADTGFYYDLHHLSDEKALVKNIVGIYPYWAGIAGESQTEGIGYLFREDYFATGSAFATVARDCPAYAHAGGWMGTHGGRNSCMWNGPSWPYTNGIALDAIGNESRKHGHAYDKEFGKFLRQYAWQHFEHHDLQRPYLVEQYDAETGEQLSDEPDYNHSYFIELIIAQVCGVRLAEEEIVIDPVDVGLHYFKVDNLRIRGKALGVSYADEWAGTNAAGIRPGFTVIWDHQTVHHSAQPVPVRIPLSDAKSAD